MLARLDSSNSQNTAWRFACANPRQVVRGGLIESIDVLSESNARWIGYISYDAGRAFEVLPSRAADDLNLPQCGFFSCDERNSAPAPPRPIAKANAATQSTFSRDQYIACVKRVKQYIAAGDVFQVNLSQRFRVPLRDEPVVIYQRLQTAAPATYGALLDFGDFQLISNSPELFLRVERIRDGRRKISTRPIKGTRPRIAGMECELRDSAKDAAELNMIVDLERNDLGRICEVGSVRVSQPRTIETHPTVYHGVATIEGILRDDVSLKDLLAATFPGGSVTGAPKIRAMQIIDELEPVRRGPYCGAIGWIGGDGTLEFSVAIRTIIVKDGFAYVSVGGGIVADSDPIGEYEETLVKARAMFDALGVGNF